MNPEKLELYNLADDLEERNDLAKREPHKVQALESKLSEHLKPWSAPASAGLRREERLIFSGLEGGRAAPR